MSAVAPLTIRDAVAADAGDLSLLLGQLGYPTEPALAAARLAALAAGGATRVLVASDGGRTLGFLALTRLDILPYARPLARITALCVADGARGEGVGSALEERAAGMARAWGCARLEVTSNRRRAGAHAFYRGRGYEESHRCFVKALDGASAGGRAHDAC